MHLKGMLSKETNISFCFISYQCNVFNLKTFAFSKL